MNLDRLSYTVSVFCLVSKTSQTHQKDILLMKRLNTGWKDDWYSLPAWHMDGNETPREALKRELFEELGIQTHVDDMIFYGVQYCRSNDERINLYFELSKRSGDIFNKEPHKCSEILRCDINVLPQQMTYCKQIIIDHQITSTQYHETLS